jgi:hypothetical protein
MRTLDASILNEVSLGLCIVDLTSNSIFRNQSFREFCFLPPTDSVDSEPTDLSVFNSLRCQMSGEQMQTLRAFSINKKFFDVVFVRHDQYEYFLVYPLEKRLVKIRDELSGRQLTDRELGITSLLLLGLSNDELCDRFGIRMNTLRTHLKSIYRKVPEAAKRSVAPDIQV